MKTLEQQFTMNADKSGVHTFTQVRRDGNVCIYRRNNTVGKLHSFEVFITKTVKAGSPLPGGGQVLEDYEQYPGASAFGRTAWSINTEKRANDRFAGLLVGVKTPKVETMETTEEETELVNVARIIKPQGDRRTIKWPKGPFTQKDLAAFNGIGNYKEVYTDLQRALASGILRISKQTKAVTRGRAAKMFEVVAAAAAVATVAI